MKYTKQEFGKELKIRLEAKYKIDKLSHWAYGIYLKHCDKFEPGLEDILMDIVVMAEGHEFKLSRDELMTIAGELENNRERDKYK